MVADDKTYQIIGAAMEIHRELGCGFLEAVYQEALEKEFHARGVPCKSQPEIRIFYKGLELNKKYRPDFVCYEDIIVEIKALESVKGHEHAQIINYLKASKKSLGLLLNFGSKSLEHKRFIFSQ